jgi:anti-sigma factor (TIGR02949 family)
VKDCPVSLAQLSAYADREVDGEEKKALERHVERCERCRFELQAIEAEKRWLKRTFASRVAPPALRTAVLDRLRAEAGTAAAAVPRWRRWWAPSPAWAAVSLFLLVAAGLIYLRTEGVLLPSGEKPTTMGLFVRDITHDAYLVARLPARPLDVASEDPRRVADVLSGFVGFPVRIPDLSTSGFRLKGGRLWHTVSRISALAVFEDGSGRRVRLFEIRGERIGLKGARAVRTDGRVFYVGRSFGFQGVAWKQHGLALGLVGDLPEEELLELARTASVRLERSTPGP